MFHRYIITKERQSYIVNSIELNEPRRLEMLYLIHFLGKDFDKNFKKVDQNNHKPMKNLKNCGKLAPQVPNYFW